MGDLPPRYLPSINEWSEKWGSVGLYPQLESLHADTFDWWDRVITLGTAIEQNFLTNDNYGMGSTIGVILILTMFITMWVTKERRER